MSFVLRCLCLVLAVASTGCVEEPPPPDDTPSRPAPLPASRFDPADCGRIAGRATWSGPVPTAPPFLFGVPLGDGRFRTELIPNPNLPSVDAETHALAGAVVFLRRIDAARSKPWDAGSVRVEMKGLGIAIRRGDGEPRRVGFVRRGEPVALLSAEPVFHVLRGRGAAFFSHAFPDPDRPISRSFEQIGCIDLTSGSGYYWASAALFVDDHPYYTITDREGRFAFDQVPSGPVDVVLWHPNWVVQRQERDPETGLISRQAYDPPLESVREVNIERGRAAEIDLTLGRSSAEK